ncbi:preprotein translocase subunit SecF [Aurantimicrobium minutum]|nr:preprotein translocase subunit SecF [Aurantimicrobium minutum]
MLNDILNSPYAVVAALLVIIVYITWGYRRTK